MRDFTIELKRIGNNLNQITRLANEGSLTIIGDNLKNINEGLKSVWGKLDKTLKKIFNIYMKISQNLKNNRHKKTIREKRLAICAKVLLLHLFWGMPQSPL